MNIVLLGMGISSGGLVSVMRDLLNYETSDSLNISLVCPPGYTNNIPSTNEKISIIETEYAIESKLSKIFGSSYSRGLIETVEALKPDAVFYITGSYKSGLEKYKSYYVLNNQLYTNYHLLFRQEDIKLIIYMSIISWRFRKYIKKIDHVFFSSDFSKESTEKVVSIKDSKVVPFACNSIFYDNVRFNENCIEKEKVDVLCIGSIIPYKNQLSVIKAIKILHDKGYGVKLKLIGSVISNTYYRKCCKYIEKNSMNGYVDYIQSLPLDEIPSAIDNCDIYVNSSETDTCGTAAEEGMARGSLVVGNDIGFNREMIGDAGLYFSVKDPSTLSSAIEKIIQDKELQKTLRYRAYKKSRERTLSDTARDYYDYIIQNS